MPWQDQKPPAEDVIIALKPTALTQGYIEIDRLSDGSYRATHGSSFGSLELCRTNDLEGLLRKLQEALWSSSPVTYQAVVHRLREQSAAERGTAD